MELTANAPNMRVQKIKRIKHDSISHAIVDCLLDLVKSIALLPCSSGPAFTSSIGLFFFKYISLSIVGIRTNHCHGLTKWDCVTLHIY